MTKNNPMTASERQRRVKIVATATTKVHGYKRRKVDPPTSDVRSEIVEQSQPFSVEREKLVEFSPESEEAVPQCDEGRIEGPGPSEGPSSGGSVSPLEDEGGPVDKSILTIEGPSDGDDVSPPEYDGGPVDKWVLTNFESHAAYAIWN